MPEKKTVTKERFLELIDGAQVADEDRWRWGYEVRYVVMPDVDGTPYLTQFVRIHLEDGLQLDDELYELTPAKEVEVTVKKWVPAW